MNQVELKMIEMSDIQSKEVAWLWYPFIPYGKLTIIQGDPGEGKTTLVLNIAAHISRGQPMEASMLFNTPLQVIYQTAEDGLEDTVKPRLEMANADCSYISVIDEREKSLSMLDTRIEQAIREKNAKLLILDPIQAYLGANMDMNRANEARDMTKHLGQIAEKTGCAIVLIGHMNKNSGGKVAYRGMGSIDFFAVARSVLLVGKIAGDENLRGMVQIKNNLAERGHAKAFRLEHGKFDWLGNYDVTEDEIVAGIIPKSTKKEKAKEMLQELSKEYEVLPVNEIIELAKERDISKRTLQDVKTDLKLKSVKMNNAWYWKLDSIYFL